METEYGRGLVNLTRLNDEMDRSRVDAVVARAGLNFTYLAGFAYPGTLARHLDLADSPRAVYVVWPRHGTPRLVVNAIAEGLAARDSWITDIDLYEGYVEQPIDRLATTLQVMGLGDAAVAFERNTISVADWDMLTSRLPGLKTSDSTTMMDNVRAVKTEAEIGRLIHGADILDDAFIKHFPTVRPGMRERDLHAALVAECIVRGSEFTHGILNSSRNTVAYAGESDFVLAAGDAIRTDYVAYFGGYPGHQSRCAVVGNPTNEQKSEYRLIRDIYRSANNQLQPGKTAGEVYQFIVDRFAEAGHVYHSMIAGHSVGCWWHQQEPIISRGNPRVLEEGMVIAMEPHINHWHIQDMFLIRADGPELISSRFPTDEIFSCF